MNYIKIPNTAVGQFFQKKKKKKQTLERPCIISEDFRNSPIFYYKYRNLYTSDKTLAQPGDIVCLPQYGTTRLYIGLDRYKANKSAYLPIAIVVVPASHTENGTVRCMSLVPMDKNTPEEGGNMYSKCAYGNGDIGVSYASVVANAGGTTTISYLEEAQFASDIIYNASRRSTTDEYVAYDNWGGDNRIPSPYNIAGGKNPLYFDTQSCTSDMDGKGNTQRMLDLATESGFDWSGTIPTNVDTANCFQAAFCCNRYHTDGTNAGDWYFPSIGELGYLRARYLRIQEALNEIPNAARSDRSAPSIKSSTQRNIGRCWAINGNRASCGGSSSGPTYKPYGSEVRAFIEL